MEQDDMDKRTCSVEGCGKPVDSHGYCHRHAQNYRLTGNPIARRYWPLEDLLRAVGWTVTGAGCWEWNGKRRGRTPETSYGIFNSKRLGYEDARAHRVAFECFVGPIPEGMQIRHKCDNPPCVNPEHLIPGTALENSRDMVERRRHWRHDRKRCDKGHDLTLPGAIKRTGGVHRCAECDKETQHTKVERSRERRAASGTPQRRRLRPDQVRSIRERRAAGAPLKELADEYGISIQGVCNICKGRSYKDAA